MIEMRQLLRIVAIVETVSNGSILRGGDVVVDLQVSCPANINNANVPEAMFGVTPTLEDDFAVKSYFPTGGIEEYFVGSCWSGWEDCGPCKHLVVVC
jgi:hypothetical protein